jgi:hypothetical protein
MIWVILGLLIPGGVITGILWLDIIGNVRLAFVAVHALFAAGVSLGLSKLLFSKYLRANGSTRAATAPLVQELPSKLIVMPVVAGAALLCVALLAGDETFATNTFAGTMLAIASLSLVGVSNVLGLVWAYRIFYSAPETYGSL